MNFNVFNSFGGVNLHEGCKLFSTELEISILSNSSLMVLKLNYCPIHRESAKIVNSYCSVKIDLYFFLPFLQFSL